MTSDTAIPDRQLWARATEGGLKAAEFGTYTTPLIRKSDTVAAVGTPLAARLMAVLDGKKFPVIRAEPPHPAFAEIPPEAEEYRTFSATYGELWNARALRQLVRRADRSFVPKEDRWHEGDMVIDPFRPGLRYSARTDAEFDLLLDRHLNAVRSAFRRCSTLIVSLGGSEICEAVADGAVITAWSEAPTGSLDPERHTFRTLTVAETIADLTDAIAGLRVFNPGMQIILMVSPEQPPATATPAHIVTANAHGKAILRVAMEEVATRPGVSYFPAFEIAAMFGNAALAEDGRTLAPKAISLVGAALLEACEGGSIEMTVAKRAAPAPAEPEPEATATATKVEKAPPAAEAAQTPKHRGAEAIADTSEEGTARPARRVVASVVDSYTNTVPARGRGVQKAPKVPKVRKARPEQHATKVAEASVEESAKATLRRERLERRTERETKKANRSKSAPVAQRPKKVRKAKPAPVDNADIVSARAEKQKEIIETREKRRKEWEEKQAKNRETRTAASSAREAGEKSAANRQNKKAGKKVAVSTEGTAGARVRGRANAGKAATPLAKSVVPIVEAESPKPVRGTKTAAKRRGRRATKPSEGSA